MDEFKINKEFAQKYDKYRKAEELQKLKDRYGDIDEDDSSSTSESEDETAEAVDLKLEKDFFHTLACIKRKDAVVYKSDEKFFEDPSTSESNDDDVDTNSSTVQTTKPNKKPFLLKDYERKVILERDGQYEPEGGDEEPKTVSGSYYAELEDIKKSFNEATEKYDKEYDADDEIMTKKDLQNGVEENSNVPLEELDSYWKNPKLEEKEKFLRDYILNRKYLDVDENEISEDSEDDVEDELFVEKQELFEHKYNTRHEEPGHEFIKTYPRTIASSVRRKDDKNKKKRIDRKERKEETKRKKMEELKRLKQLKREEIVEKIYKLRAASGNVDIDFTDRDINDEFDPEAHDRRMKELFDDGFYAEADDEKPQFSDIGEDEFGEETNWNEDYENGTGGYDQHLPDCEQQDFVMDCDYQPKPGKKEKSKQTSVGKKKKKSEFYDAIEGRRIDDDATKSIDQHLEEYYAMDYDDLIGDMPCRFKYRSVPANDYGLSAADILLADNKVLNSWCSLKRVVQHRSEEDERDLKRHYARKSRSKKRKYFDQLYKDLQEEKSTEHLEDEGKMDKSSDAPRRKLNSHQRRRKREREKRLQLLGLNEPSSRAQSEHKSKKSFGQNKTLERLSKINTSRLEAYGLKPNKVMKKAKYGSHKKPAS